MLFHSSNGYKYIIKVETENLAIFRFIDHTKPDTITMRFIQYDLQEETIYWNKYRGGSVEENPDDIDVFAPNDLREYCQKIVKNIILL
jgi:hypothetical protein